MRWKRCDPHELPDAGPTLDGSVPAVVALVIVGCWVGIAWAAKSAPAPEPNYVPDLLQQIAPLKKAAISLPVAAMLGGALSFRPRLRGTPPRTPTVIHTQVLLALVGAVVMLVVGSSLARAFGIVGAASLVRYRAKIDDPKDAGVMLASLGVGLASGVGLYLLAAFATLFNMVVLLIVESLGPDGYRLFDLTVTAKAPGSIPAGIETVLKRHRVAYELRRSSAEEVCYQVRLPFDRSTDRVADALLKLDKGSEAAITWDEKKIKAPPV